MAGPNRHYGWVRDLPDHRDFLYAAPIQALQALPTSVDLRPNCPPIYDQGQLGSCTANAIAGAVQFDQLKEHQQTFTPSRLFIYYNERVIEHTVNSDSGAQLRDGIKTVAKQGVCPENMWPYNITMFEEKPTNACYQEARQYEIKQYQRLVQNLNQMKGCLATGTPFVYGFSVYESFESETVAATGHAPLPQPSEQMVGGHAVVAVGYDDANQWFICRNSWGTTWGMNGYFTIPYAYLTDPNLASDFWTIQVV
jgi:C1A family cysteine protease